MQIPPGQGPFMAFLIKLIGAKIFRDRNIYRLYAFSMALAKPDDGEVITCEVNTEWSNMGLNIGNKQR